VPLRFTFDINFVGEARILQGELGYMDQQGPSVPVRLTTSSSDAQVGPSKSEPFSGTGQPLLYSLYYDCVITVIITLFTLA
jgi:hypothetical protein